jgi:hypothetical protein
LCQAATCCCCCCPVRRCTTTKRVPGQVCRGHPPSSSGCWRCHCCRTPAPLLPPQQQRAAGCMVLLCEAAGDCMVLLLLCGEAAADAAAQGSHRCGRCRPRLAAAAG